MGSNEKLAIFGGPKTVPSGLLKPWPEVTADDKKAVMEVLDSGTLWGAAAPQITALQEDWANYVGAKYCLATNSGTAALHMCIAALGIGPGDEVITTPFSWTSTATCILHHNAIPVFADIDPYAYTLDPAKIEEKITPRTKAILPVHIYGEPANMDEILRIARKHNLYVIEDACQAHGVTIRGQHVGTFGDVAAFSLNGSKTLSSGEGGLFVTNNKELYEEAARVQQFGESRRSDGKREYNAYGMGWMYRTSEMPAAFARSQLRRLTENVDGIRALCHYVSDNLKDIKGLRTPVEYDWGKHAFWRYNLHLIPEEIGVDMPLRDYTDRIKAALIAEGVTMGRYEFVIPRMTLFQEMRGYGKGCPWDCKHYTGHIKYRVEDYPVAINTIDRIVALEGLKPPNTKELADHYVQAVRKVFDHVDELVKADLHFDGPVGGN